MGYNIEMFKFDYDDLAKQFAKEGKTSNIELIKNIMDEFGIHIDNKYIILKNELWEEYNSFYELPKAILMALGYEYDDETVDLFKAYFEETSKKESIRQSCQNAYEVLDKLRIEVE